MIPQLTNPNKELLVLLSKDQAKLSEHPSRPGYYNLKPNNKDNIEKLIKFIRSQYKEKDRKSIMVQSSATMPDTITLDAKAHTFVASVQNGHLVILEEDLKSLKESIEQFTKGLQKSLESQHIIACLGRFTSNMERHIFGGGEHTLGQVNLGAEFVDHFPESMKQETKFLASSYLKYLIKTGTEKATELAKYKALPDQYKAGIKFMAQIVETYAPNLSVNLGDYEQEEKEEASPDKSTEDGADKTYFIQYSKTPAFKR